MAKNKYRIVKRRWFWCFYYYVVQSIGRIYGNYEDCGYLQNFAFYAHRFLTVRRARQYIYRKNEPGTIDKDIVVWEE